MTYIENFYAVKATIAKEKAKKISEHLAIQVNLTDDEGDGIFYIEVRDGVLHVEPYDYVDRDAIFFAKTPDLVAIMTGKLGYDEAIEKNRLTVAGNTEKASLAKLLITKKRAPKKTAAKTKK